MIKILSRIIATIMLVLGVAFIIYAIHHPTESFPWSLEITYAMYYLYLIGIIVLYIAPFKKK